MLGMNLLPPEEKKKELPECLKALHVQSAGRKETKAEANEALECGTLCRRSDVVETKTEFSSWDRHPREEPARRNRI